MSVYHTHILSFLYFIYEFMLCTPPQCTSRTHICVPHLHFIIFYSKYKLMVEHSRNVRPGRTSVCQFPIIFSCTKNYHECAVKMVVLDAHLCTTLTFFYSYILYTNLLCVHSRSVRPGRTSVYHTHILLFGLGYETPQGKPGKKC